MLRRLQQGIRRFVSNSLSRSETIVSFVLIVYDMPAQAQNTVRSLLPDYQLDVRLQDYEVIIVENESANTMSREFLKYITFQFFLSSAQGNAAYPDSRDQLWYRAGEGRQCLRDD